MRSIESTGRSIDEAIFNGLQQLEVSIDGVEIEILQQESKGILGIGARPAKVRLTEREPEEIVIPDYLKEQPRPPRERRERRDRGERGRSRGNSRPGRSQEMEKTPAAENLGDEPMMEAPAQRPERGERTERAAREKRRERERKPAIPYSLEAAAENPAAQFLLGLIHHMGVEGQVLAYADEEGVRLCVDTPTMGVLIGHRGETLDAMQYLTSLAVNRNRKEEGYTRITLDTEGYREKREETLARLARKLAAQVKATGRPKELEPMNPYERRVLHASLQNNPYVTTYSEGEEPNRYVVIAPKPREIRKEPRNRGNNPQRITQVEEVETVEIYHPQPLDRAPAPESALAPDSPAAEQE